MARRFSQQFCIIGIVIGLVVVLAMSFQQSRREGASEAGDCHSCGPNPIDICLSAESDAEMQQLNPYCALPGAGAGPNACSDVRLINGLADCVQPGCTRTWTRAPMGGTIQKCFGAASKLTVGFSKACKRCLMGARDISNDHLLNYDGTALVD